MITLKVLMAAAVLCAIFVAGYVSEANATDSSISVQKDLSLEENVRKSFDDNWTRLKQEKQDKALSAKEKAEREKMLFKMVVQRVAEELEIDRGMVLTFIKEDDYITKQPSGIFKKRIPSEKRIRKNFQVNWERLREEKEDDDEALFKMVVKKVSQELGIADGDVLKTIKKEDYLGNAEKR